jgi:hypothetical protein
MGGMSHSDGNWPAFTPSLTQEIEHVVSELLSMADRSHTHVHNAIDAIERGEK